MWNWEVDQPDAASRTRASPRRPEDRSESREARSGAGEVHPLPAHGAGNRSGGVRPRTRPGLQIADLAYIDRLGATSTTGSSTMPICRRLTRITAARCRYCSPAAPAGQWVLKLPSHALHLEALLSVYPDARLVITHRDPLPSLVSMCSYAAMIHARQREPGRPRRARRCDVAPGVRIGDPHRRLRRRPSRGADVSRLPERTR